MHTEEVKIKKRKKTNASLNAPMNANDIIQSAYVARSLKTHNKKLLTKNKSPDDCLYSNERDLN